MILKLILFSHFQFRLHLINEILRYAVQSRPLPPLPASPSAETFMRNRRDSGAITRADRQSIRGPYQRGMGGPYQEGIQHDIKDIQHQLVELQNLIILF